MLCLHFTAESFDRVLSRIQLFIRSLAFHGDKSAAHLHIRHIVLAESIQRGDRTRYSDIEAVAQLCSGAVFGAAVDKLNAG